VDVVVDVRDDADAEALVLDLQAAAFGSWRWPNRTASTALQRPA
jgi:hypothetical protein